ncbi:CBS domain-containing protein [Neiella marina]|uniref:CBS domain-containing protein n=1 Tax=Neiella holothuriorum TaxID=2870530 RepID=A0ABS7EC48_9GAMM|nr:CBS domain-containing protein [Neiella holothuriorum]MBW8189906.1 CBS domain-containing protein [Neiella holothuriorum]
MAIDRIMNRKLVSVELDDNLGTVKEIFDNAHFHHLLVIEDGHLEGVLSDRDLLLAISPNIGTRAETPKDRQALKRPVHQIMTRDPLTLRSDASIFEAIRLFNRNPISCLPIVNEERQPVGIVTWRDILKAIEQDLLKKMASAKS